MNTTHPLTRLALALSTLVSLSALSACEAPIEEPSVESAYHVFGVKAEPPVARPDDKVTFTIYDRHPRQQELLYSWSACLYSYGAEVGFKCVSPEFKNVFSEDSPRVTIDLGPEGVDLRGQLAAFEELPDVDGEPPSLERGHDIYIIVSSGFPTDPGGLKRTVKRLHVIDAPGEEPLAKNPEIIGWSVSTNAMGEGPCMRTPVGPFTLADLEDNTALSGLIDPDGALLEQGRAYVAREVTSLGEPCVVRAQSTLDVDLTTTAGSVEPSAPHLFNWLADEAPYAAQSWVEGGLFGEASVGRYLLPNRSGALELYFTVRDNAGGFAVGYQPLTLVPNKTTASAR